MRIKMTLIALAITALMANALLWAALQEHPPAPGQPEFCVVNHKDPQYICKCLDHDSGKGCVATPKGRGRNSEEGMAGICVSHCRISNCHCCLS